MSRRTQLFTQQAVKGTRTAQAPPTCIHTASAPTFDAHLAYQVENVATWQSYLEQHDITVLESVAIPGLECFEARGPFGNRFECIQPLE